MRKRKEIKKKVDREKLLGVLEQLKPGLSSKPIVEELSHFHFRKDTVSAYNQEILMRADYYTGIECSVKAELLLKLLGGMKGKEIEFVKREEELLVEGASASFGLAYSDLGKVYDEIESVEIGKGEELTEDFLTALDLCSFAATQDMTVPELTVICISGYDVLSTDKMRCSWYELEDEYPKMLVPSYSVARVRKKDFTKFAYDDKWFHLMKDGVSFSCLLKDVDYPEEKIKGFFPGSKKKKKGYKLPAKEIREALDSVAVFLEGDFILDKEVYLCLEEDRVLLEINKAGLGWYSEEIPLKGGPKKPMELKVNPEFLGEALKHLTRFYWSGESLVELAMDDKPFRHIISL